VWLLINKEKALKKRNFSCIIGFKLVKAKKKGQIMEDEDFVKRVAQELLALAEKREPKVKKPHGNTGRKKSKETREKLSKALKGNTNRKGTGAYAKMNEAS
jgi:hypothetical protein